MGTQHHGLCLERPGVQSSVTGGFMGSPLREAESFGGHQQLTCPLLPSPPDRIGCALLSPEKHCAPGPEGEPPAQPTDACVSPGPPRSPGAPRTLRVSLPSLLVLLPQHPEPLDFFPGFCGKKQGQPKRGAGGGWDRRSEQRGKKQSVPERPRTVTCVLARSLERTQ